MTKRAVNLERLNCCLKMATQSYDNRWRIMCKDYLGPLLISSETLCSEKSQKVSPIIWVARKWLYFLRDCYLVLLMRLFSTRSICWSTMFQSMAMTYLFSTFFRIMPSSMNVSATSWGWMLVLDEMSWTVIWKRETF